MQEKKTIKNLRIRKVCIVGVIPSFAFQRAKHCALELHRKLPQRFPLPEIVGLLELDWSEKLQEWRQMLGREYWCLRRPVAVFFDNRFIGSDIELIKLTSISNILMDTIPRKDMACLKQNFQRDYISYLKKSKRVYCFLDICIDDVYVGTLTFRLYSDLLPRTCENFKTLCLGSRGPLLTYKGSRIHRIVKKGWLQGGDIQYKTGGGGFSIFCDPLEDECFGISHDRRGVLSMANGGRHKNGSQFFITLQPSKWMDTHFVAFGQLIEGVKVLKTLENLDTFYESPIRKVEIKNCGKLDLGDVEDIDVLYKEERMPAKKRKRIETISEQIMRQIMEALTEALVKKVHAPDILDEGDVPSKMNLQLYFQGFYSLPQSIYERSAAYLRNLRRELFRLMKPSATEVVESLVYDLQMAVLTRMTNLDDMRETLGRELYNKMVGGIGMTLEGCRKSYVKRFIDQIVTTAENMVDLVTRKLLMMKGQSKNLKNFQERMDNWVMSFVLQETYEGDNYFIAERPIVKQKPKEVAKEGKECCAEERRKKESELKAKMRAKYAPDDLCCLGSQVHLSDSEINIADYFSSCRDALKRKGKPAERMPLLDLIEISRFKLRWIRHQENRKRTPEVLCTERKIRKWMEEVIYTAETSWLKDAVFPRDCRVLDHVEEIMYGAMTAGLLEMYFYAEEYLRICGGKRKKLVTKTMYPEDWSSDFSDDLSTTSISSSSSSSSSSGAHRHHRRVTLGGDDQDWDGGRGGRGWRGSADHDGQDGRDGRDGKDGRGDKDGKDGKDKYGKDLPEGFERIPCPCGHPCCDCEYDPNQKPGEKKGDAAGEKGKKRKADKKGSGTDARDGKEEKKWKLKRKFTGRGYASEDGEEESEEGEEEEEEEGKDKKGGKDGEGKTDGGQKVGKGKTCTAPDAKKVCKSDETLVQLNTLLAQRLSTTPESVNIHSFRWLKPYILKNGCDLKTKFAAQVHEWIEGEQFNPQGFFSQHSLVTKASILSLSLSLAELIKEENNVKVEIKNFIYDLWDLYFEEMFKEALLEFPPKEKEVEEEDEEGAKQETKKKARKFFKTGMMFGFGAKSDDIVGGRSYSAYGARSYSAYGTRSHSAYGIRSHSAEGARSHSAYGARSQSTSGARSQSAYGARSHSAFGVASVGTYGGRTASTATGKSKGTTVGSASVATGRSKAAGRSTSATTERSKATTARGRSESTMTGRSRTTEGGRSGSTVTGRSKGTGRSESIMTGRSKATGRSESIMTGRSRYTGRSESILTGRSKAPTRGRSESTMTGRSKATRSGSSATQRSKRSASSNGKPENGKGKGRTGRSASADAVRDKGKHGHKGGKHGHKGKDGKDEQDETGSEFDEQSLDESLRSEGGRSKKKNRKKLEEDCKKLKEMLNSAEFERMCKELQKEQTGEAKQIEGEQVQKLVEMKENEEAEEGDEEEEEQEGMLDEVKEIKKPDDHVQKSLPTRQSAPKSMTRVVTLDEKSTVRKSEETDGGLKKALMVQKSASRMFLIDEKANSRKSEAGRASKKSRKGEKRASDVSHEQMPTFKTFKDVRHSPSISLEGEGTPPGRTWRYQSTVDDAFDLGPQSGTMEVVHDTEERKTPIVIQELVDDPSVEEVREMPPYVKPFWIKFLTEMTKQALGTFSRVSRLPRRLYLKTDSQMQFDEKMKDWFEFNAFNPQPTKGREVMDFIALHHKALSNLDDTARSFLRKKKFSKLINRCTRFASADELSSEILVDAIKMSHDNARASTSAEDDTVELFVSGVLSSAAASKAKGEEDVNEDDDEQQYDTDRKEPTLSEYDE